MTIIQRLRNPPLGTETSERNLMAQAAAEIERLKGMKPAPLDTPIPAGTIPRYMVRWNGPTEPLAVPSDDGYWTPWHVAHAEIEDKEASLDMMRSRLGERETLLRQCREKNKRLEARAALAGKEDTTDGH